MRTSKLRYSPNVSGSSSSQLGVGEFPPEPPLGVLKRIVIRLGGMPPEPLFTILCFFGASGVTRRVFLVGVTGVVMDPITSMIAK